MNTRKAFTLIELLVVISILVMLMAILLPTVERARKRARAVACQAKMHQWSLVFKMYTDGNGGRWFDHPVISYTYDNSRGWLGIRRDGRKSMSNWVGLTAPFWFKTADFAACPMAIKGRRPEEPYRWDAFTPWCPKEWGPVFFAPSGEPIISPVSYEVNYCIALPPPQHPDSSLSPKEVYWGTCDVQGAARIPVFFDCARHLPSPADYAGPPLFEAGLLGEDLGCWPMCINRHDAGINMLFMDWSVRKVGLKELWTFKWHKQFNTAGPWTKQGGVEAPDWPQWMRRFKDY